MPSAPDAFGQFLLAALVEGGIETSRVARHVGAASGMSVAIGDAGGDYGAVIVSGANLLLDPAALASAGLWRGAQALILQNELPEAANLAAARGTGGRRAHVCLNAAPFRAPAELMALLDLLVVNTRSRPSSWAVPP
ncbi:MAG: hypothetical protein U1E17_04335 [Geminicoccaceae bacterium]